MSRFVFSVLFITVLVLGGCAGTGSRPEDNRHQADVHHKLAEAHLQANNPGAALRELLRAVELQPNNGAIHASLAQAYQQRRAYSEAEKSYLQALKLSGNDPRYQNNLANLYLLMEQWDKAVTYFDLAAANLLFDSTEIAMTGKGYAYFRQGDYASALQVLREVTVIAPDFAPAYYYQAEIYRQINDAALEKIALRQTIELAPDLIPARYRLAVLLMQENSLQQARQQLEIILKFAADSDEGIKAAELIKTIPKN